jgi:hypothetical protein
MYGRNVEKEEKKESYDKQAIGLVVERLYEKEV